MNDMHTFIIGISLVFTIAILVAMALVLRQVMHSKWIDSRTHIMSWVLVIFVILLLIAFWGSVLFYAGIL